MYKLSIYSIFRNAHRYYDTYMRQVEALLEQGQYTPKDVYFKFLTGDNVDDTEAVLNKWAVAMDVGYNIMRLDTGKPYYPSQDDPIRWQHLENIWNTNINGVVNSEICMLVESDLQWGPEVPLRLISAFNYQWQRLPNNQVSALYPMLWKWAGGKHFYDINGFRRNGRHFRNFPPYIPDDENIPFLPVDTGGGLIITNSYWLKQAVWKNKCVLHFPPRSLKLLSKMDDIYHP